MQDYADASKWGDPDGGAHRVQAMYMVREGPRYMYATYHVINYLFFKYLY